jgi:hypothetical protein
MLEINSTLGMKFLVTSRDVARVSDRSICVVYLKPVRRLSLPENRTTDTRATPRRAERIKRFASSSCAAAAVKQLAVKHSYTATFMAKWHGSRGKMRMEDRIGGAESHRRGAAPLSGNGLIGQ